MAKQGASEVLTSTSSGNLTLLKRQAEKNRRILFERDLTGKTALHSAAQNGHRNVVEFLVTTGVDVNSTDNDGWTPLHCACNEGHLDVARYLLSQGANVHAPTSQGGIALHYAVRSHQNNPFLFLSVMDKFASTLGFNVNAENHFGETPLHSAVMRGNELAVVWLLKHGADPNVPNKKRMTPLHMACMVSSATIVRLLLHMGAKPNMQSDNGTPIEIAQSSHSEEIIALVSSPTKPADCVVYEEIQQMINAFAALAAKGAQCFEGRSPFVTVRFGRTNRFAQIDLQAPVANLVTHFESVFGLPHEDQYLLFLQSRKPIASKAARSPFFAYALDDSQTLASQMPPDFVDDLPAHYWLSLKRRKALLAADQVVLDRISQTSELVDFDRVGKALVTVFEASGRSDQLLKWAIALELRNTEQSGTIFREDSLATKIVTHYLRLIGRHYLHTMLGSTIRTVASSHQCYEVDPHRPDAKRSNLNKIKKLVKSFLSTIFKSLDYCPFQVWQLTHRIREVVHARHPESALSAVAAFLFLRFICPVITTPHSHGLLDEPPTAEATRGLILVAKVLQNLANGVLFGEKEQYLVDMNRLLTKKQNELKQFLTTLSMGDIPAVAPPGTIHIDDDVETDAEKVVEKFLVK